MTKWVYFKSSMFEAEPEEAEEVNPGKCGKQLASWLAKKFAERGVIAEDIYPEDWGYEINISGDGTARYLGCQNWGDSLDEWACFIEVKYAEELSSLQDLLMEILRAEAQISEIKWD